MERNEAMLSVSRRTLKSICNLSLDKKEKTTKKEKKRKCEKLFNCCDTLIFQFTSPKHTPEEFNHILAKIQLCVMTSSAMN